MAVRDALGKFASLAWTPAFESETMGTAVSSSNVAAVGYNPNTRVMDVTFNSGSIYNYFDVPLDVYETLISASSVGGTLHQIVKGHYAYERVG